MINPSLSQFLTQSIQHLVNPLFRQISNQTSNMNLRLAHIIFKLLRQNVNCMHIFGGLYDGARFTRSDTKNQKSLTCQKNRSVSMDTLDTQFWKVSLTSSHVRRACDLMTMTGLLDDGIPTSKPICKGSHAYN